MKLEGVRSREMGLNGKDYKLDRTEMPYRKHTGAEKTYM